MKGLEDGLGRVHGEFMVLGWVLRPLTNSWIILILGL